MYPKEEELSNTLSHKVVAYERGWVGGSPGGPCSDFRPRVYNFVCGPIDCSSTFVCYTRCSTVWLRRNAEAA